MTHQKEPHTHAEIIKAKADDMELVTLIKKHVGWRVGNEQDEVIFDSTFEYFLCLPKHRDAALNALNGGEAQVNFGELWQRANCGEPVSWMRNGWYMSDDCESRIKPKKEKRWIGHFERNGKFFTTECSYETLDQLKRDAFAPHGFDHWQFIEIEVEV